MSFIYEQPRLPGRISYAGGEAGLGSIYDAAYEAAQFADNATGRIEALERAYDERIRAIREATGVKLENPIVEADTEFRRRFTDPAFDSPPAGSALTRREWRNSDVGQRQLLAAKETAFGERMGELAEKFPEAHGAIAAHRPILDDAERLAREAEAQYGAVAGSRTGAGKWLAAFAGGGLGALRDPLTVGSLVAGGGSGAARTIAGRILTVAAKEALINAGSEAVIQPSVQAWREQAGLDAGLDEAIRNIAFAGAFGGAFGAAGGSLAEGLRVLRPREREVAADALSRNAKLPERTRQALAGDVGAAAEILPDIRANLPAEARGALDARLRDEASDGQRPPAASMRTHDEAVARADQAINASEPEPFFADPDPDQVERITKRLTGDGETDAAAGDGLVSFLTRQGGLQEYRGELAAIGADQVSERFVGRLVRQDGLPLDRAREAAAEAGFFDARYGTPGEAVAKSTVADLLDAIDAEVNAGRRTGAAGDEADYVRNLVDQVARYAGPGVSDDIIEQAARLANEQGSDPFDALESVLIAADDAPAVRKSIDELPPGWSDEELEAASASRGGVPELAGPEPKPNESEGLLSPADIEGLDDDLQVPVGDGTMTIDELQADIARAETLQTIVEACRV